MRLECAKCGSGNIIDDYDYINRIAEKKCISCGSRRVNDIEAPPKEIEFKNTDNKEGIMPAPIERQCKEEGCDKQAVKDGFCIKHYKKNNDGGVAHSRCKEEGCAKQAVKEDLCCNHYKEKTGSTAHRRCKDPGCDKQVWNGGYCYRHFKHPELRSPITSDIKKPDDAIRGKSPLVSSAMPINPAIDHIASVYQILHSTFDILNSEIKKLSSEINMWVINKPFSPEQPGILTIDFTGHEDLFEQLKDMALKDFRTPAQEVLYLVARFGKSIEVPT